MYMYLYQKLPINGERWSPSGQWNITATVAWPSVAPLKQNGVTIETVMSFLAILHFFLK